MKQRLKGLLALVLSLMMVFALATNAWAAVTVGGHTFNETNGYTVSGNQGTATYDSATNTLTLDNFVYNGNSKIYSDGNLTLNLIGNNAVTYDASGGAAVQVTGHLTIKGDNGSSLTVSSTYSNTDGIYADNVTIESGIVTAVGDTHGLSASNVNIKGGTVTATGDEDCGIYTEDGNVTISGGTVKATGEKYGIFADKGSQSSGGMKVTISGGSVEAYATDDSDGIGIYASGYDGEIAISGTNTEVTVGCATGLKASTVNILENSIVRIDAALTAIDSSTLNFGGNWYQWSTNNPGETTPISSATKAFALNNYGGTGQNPVPTSFTIEKISTGGPTTPQPPAYYPIYIPAVEDEPEKVEAAPTFDGGIASAVVVTILSATGGAWLAKKKD